ncbi:hypothetical protein [Thioalkalivibrio sp. ALE11]|uniref:hypothetical protein n=1 Tax=Thioalkalivibrio sp. ALE11 TaxID=1265494 RepID=UPI0003789780|nr:hypothetical protein [Thioalkalivibrio sp. ALE11]
MVDGIQLILALGLPWMAASLLLLRWWPAEAPGRWAGALGMGYFLAMFGVAALLLVLDRILGGWHFSGILVLAGLLAAAGGWLARERLDPRNAPLLPESSSGTDPLAVCWKDAALWIRLAVVLVLALLLVRLGGWLVEVLWRPVYGWDAYYYWSYRARGFFEHGGADIFSSPGALLRGDAGPYGLSGADRHPLLVSLIQMWPALALGYWHDSLVNLPWFLAGAALGLALYGYLRRFSLGILPAILGTYMALSVPLLGVHAGLGGYADIWMVGGFAVAALALFALYYERRWQEWLVLLPLLLAIPFIKQSGILFSFALLLAALFAWLRPGWGVAAGVAIVAAGVLAVLTVEARIDLPILGTLVLDAGRVQLPRGGWFEFEPQWGLFLQRLVVDGSWHLVFVLGLALMVLTIPLAWRQRPHRAWWALLMAVGVMTLVVYGGTGQAARLEDGTSFGRHVMPLAPVVLAWLWLCAYTWTRETTA